MKHPTNAPDVDEAIDHLDRLLARGAYYKAPGQSQSFADLVAVADQLHLDVAR